MKSTLLKKTTLIIIGSLLLINCAQAQRFLSEYDSTMFINDTLKPLINRFKNLHISAYIQPQYQVAQEKGISSYAGRDFPEFSSNRFMLRRSRLKIDYLLPHKERKLPKALFTFQFEATERSVNVRDMFLRVYDPAKGNFSMVMGIVARPFGYEVNLSSSYRETPERGRMSQILVPSERDLGAMLTYEPKHKKGKTSFLKVDAGLFNGQGLSGTTDFDSYKDFISRLTIKPIPITESFSLSGGLSLLRGGWRQDTKYKYQIVEDNGNTIFKVDSSVSNIGGKAPRKYYGADMQLVFKSGWGKTELRGEYWRGIQPGTAATTVNPGVMPEGPTYIRNFDGAFFYFLQNIINDKWEAVVKYDWYDPNTKVAGQRIGNTGANFTEADIKYNTWGFGVTHYYSETLKFIIYYDRVKNEKTSLNDFEHDIRDDVLTLRMQLRF